jgi:hypothetical protein
MPGLPTPGYQADFTPLIANGNHAVAWGKGHLISFGFGEMKDPVVLFDKTGKSLFETFPTFENARKTYGHDAAATRSGTAVFAGSATTADGASADFIAEIGNEGIRHVIRTSPFYPLKVCVTDQGTVWAYGEELTADRAAEPRAHYPMLREYSFDKGELRTALDRATVRPPSGVPIGGAHHDAFLQCGAKSVVLVSGPTNELMEYELSTSHLTRTPIAPLPDGFYLTGIALTDSAELYASTLKPGAGAQTGMLRLQRDASGAQWKTLTMVSPHGGNFFLLMGSDGEDLVYSRGRHNATAFWSKALKQEGAK